MLGSLSSLVELVKIILLSEDNTQNKLGLTQVFHFDIIMLDFLKFSEKL